MKQKNYGVMKYSTRPTSKHYAKYLSDIFNLNTTDRVQRAFAEVDPSRHLSEIDIKAVRGIFIEQQLNAHGRQRLCPEYDLSLFQGCDTLKAICERYIDIQDRLHKNAREAYKEYQNDSNNDEKWGKYTQANTQRNDFENQNYDMATKYRDVKSQQPRKQQQANQDSPKPRKQETQAQRDMRKEAHDKWLQENGQDLSQYVRDSVDSDFVKSQVDKIDEHEQRANGMQACHATLPPQYETNEQGAYECNELSSTLSRILEDIVGQSEVRSMERGYNRPARASHFIKGAFLPSYKANKPRKRPAFFIDASGSMEDRRGKFNCVSSAIGGFLWTQHRKISELRPRYFAFTSGYEVEEFDIKQVLPRAWGGTDIRFLSAIRDNEKSIVITDACFSGRDLAMLRIWAERHPHAEVHWIVNYKESFEDLKKMLKGLKNQKVYYTMF